MDFEMTAESLEKEQRLLEDRYIPFLGFGEEGYEGTDLDPTKSGSMPDGVADPQTYLSSKYRICWVLKEPYESPDGEGNTGGYSLIEGFTNPNQYPDTVKSKTWKPMIYVTHSLLNGFAPYSEVDKWFVENGPQAAQCLRSIALINVSKMPGKSKSVEADIARKYQFWRPILFWQLRQYQPQIVMFGNTLQHFMPDLGIKELTQGKGVSGAGDVWYAVKNGVLYMNLYHPSYVPRGISLEDYVQGVAYIAKNWAEGNIGSV